MLKDTSRGLIYLVNFDGLWVLRLEPATDIQLEKEYLHHSSIIARLNSPWSVGE